MSDLVNKLRAVQEDYDFHQNSLVNEAADRIDQLEALIRDVAIPKLKHATCKLKIGFNADTTDEHAALAKLREAIK